MFHNTHRPSFVLRAFSTFLLVAFLGTSAAAPQTAYAQSSNAQLGPYIPVSVPNSRVISNFAQNIGAPPVAAYDSFTKEAGGNPVGVLRRDSFSSSLRQYSYNFAFHYQAAPHECDQILIGDDEYARGALSLNMSTPSIDFPAKQPFFIDTEDGRVTVTAPSCHPVVAPTPSNTTLPSGGPLEVVQSANFSPLLTAKESIVQVAVESLPEDNYRNVRVTVTTTAGAESYDARYARGGKVSFSLPGEYTAIDNVLLKEGWSHFIEWYTDWYGSVPTPSFTSEWFENESWRQLYQQDPFANGVPSPQIVQTAAAYPIVTDVVIRPRNSDIVYMTKPECYQGASDGFWKAKVWVDCYTYGISADGRKGDAHYHEEKSSRGFGFQLLGLVALFTGFAIGAQFGILSGLDFGSLAAGGLGIESAGILVDLWAGTITAGQVAVSASALTGSALLTPLLTLTAAIVQAAAGPSSLGKVENSNSLGVGPWNWTEPWVPPGACPEGQERSVEGNCVPRGQLPSVSVSVAPSAVVTPNTFRVTMSSIKADSCTWSRSGTYAGNWSGEPVPAPGTSYDSGTLAWPVGNATWTFTCINSAGSATDSGSVVVTDDATAMNGACSVQHYDCDAGSLEPGSQSSGSASWTWACRGENGGASASCTEAKQSAAPVPTANLSANPSAIDAGQSSRLFWSSVNATSCTSSGGFSTGGAPSNSTGVSTGVLNDTTTYQITCEGPGGTSAPAQATVTVERPQADVSASPLRVPKGLTSTVTWSATGVQDCQVSGPSLASSARSGSQAVTINTQSVFTITCATRGTPVTDSVLVNINPSFIEF